MHCPEYFLFKLNVLSKMYESKDISQIFIMKEVRSRYNCYNNHALTSIIAEF